MISITHKITKPPAKIKITANTIPKTLPLPKLLNNLIKLPYTPYNNTKINLTIHGKLSILFANPKNPLFFAININSFLFDLIVAHFFKV